MIESKRYSDLLPYGRASKAPTKEATKKQVLEITQLKAEISSYSGMRKTKPLDLKKEFKQASKQRRKIKQAQKHDRGPEPEPDL